MARPTSFRLPVRISRSRPRREGTRQLQWCSFASLIFRVATASQRISHAGSIAWATENAQRSPDLHRR